MSATAQPVTTPAMSLEALQQTREFQACTPKQRLWISGYVSSGGDFHFATRSAYDSRCELNAQILSHKVRVQSAVVAALRLWDPTYGKEVELDEREEREQFFAAIKRKILRGKLTIADVEAIKMVCRERHWSTPENLPRGRNGYTPKPKPKFQIGDEVIQEGIRYRVTKVDAAGKVLDAEEI